MDKDKPDYHPLNAEVLPEIEELWKQGHMKKDIHPYLEKRYKAFFQQETSRERCPELAIQKSQSTGRSC